MTYGKPAMHGLRVLMPFTDRIAIRAFAAIVLAIKVLIPPRSPAGQAALPSVP